MAGAGRLNGEKRRQEIRRLLAGSRTPVSGGRLAKEFAVSRQIIVQDIALLRSEGVDVIATNLGYVLMETPQVERVFKVQHSEADAEKEMNLIVDYGGCVKNVFVYHKVYGTMQAELNIHSRRDVMAFLEEIKAGKSSLLSNVTSGYHYHTVTAEDEETLDLIQNKLREAGFLAQLQDFEPIDFWDTAVTE